MFGRKLELSLESTMGGRKLTHEPRGMPYGLASYDGPWIPGDGEVRTIAEVGTIQGRCISSGFAGLGEFEAARAANHTAVPDRRPHRDVSIDARLARLGIGGRHRLSPR